METLSEDLMEQMKALFDGMQKAYDDVAAKYEFSCEGCEDNCCKQRFFHHTMSEYYYLREGVKRAEPELIKRILTRSRIVVDTFQREVGGSAALPVMCPVNEEGRCTIYEFRPMICRLHGLPHNFTRPDDAIIEGGGCQRFQDQNETVHVFVDRTPFYTELARIEKEVRDATGFMDRVRMTTAGMLMDMWMKEPFLKDIRDD
jgi:Fe-S-cluster containining protein